MTKGPSPKRVETKIVSTPLQSSSHETWSGREIPTNSLSSLLPLNNKETLKPEAYALSRSAHTSSS